MSELTTQLPERLNNTEETGLDAVLLIPLLRLIVEGGPVTVEQFAAAAGRPVDDVRTGLAAVPDTEYDDQGRIHPENPGKSAFPGLGILHLLQYVSVYWRRPVFQVHEWVPTSRAPMRGYDVPIRVRGRPTQRTSEAPPSQTRTGRCFDHPGSVQ
ncbi:hypothetical protein [Janibacter indicus]|uniref:hypothetical protein n=1 Tax=Janibacter indicus TaxID=857417 RepID=UPI003D9A3AE7